MNDLSLPILRSTVAAFALALVGFGSSALAQEQSVAGEPTFEERYGTLLENNLFVRDRKPVRREVETPRETTRPAPPPPPPPETEWVLTGIVFEEGLFRAYFENVRNAEIQRVAPGEGIARGFIGDVFIDGVSFVHDGQTAWIDFGRDLTGKVPSPVARRESSEDADGSTTAPASSDGDGDIRNEDKVDENLSLIERMRRRRQQESDG